MPSPPSRWTLQAKLLASVLALFSVIMLATGALTLLETQRYLERGLVSDLSTVLSRVDVDPDRDGRTLGPRGRGDGPAGAPGGGDVLVLGLNADGTVATTASGVAINAVVNEDRQDDVLDSNQVRRIAQADVGTQPRRVQIGGDVGTYLLKADTLPGGSRLIVGVSTHPVDELLAKLLALVAGGTVLGLVAVGVGGTVLIRRSLAPLDRVAATARRVSALKLDSGDVALAERVPAADADPRTEVGQVGLALNTMLDNVESALHTRHCRADASAACSRPGRATRLICGLRPIAASRDHAGGSCRSSGWTKGCRTWTARR